MVNQDGLEWIRDGLYLAPRWTKDPDTNVIASLARQHLPGSKDNSTTSVDVKFLTESCLNKIYTVSSLYSKQKYMMRVSLPVDPHYMVSSEVATIKFMGGRTTAPVPKLGFEWMLMEMCDGVPIRKKWRKMAWEKKEEAIRQLARYQAELFGKRFEGIGNLYAVPPRGEASHQETSTLSSLIVAVTEAKDIPSTAFTVSRIVSRLFFWKDRVNYDVPRGPFSTSHEWLHTSLRLVIMESENVINITDDEDDLEEAQDNKAVAELLLDLLPTVFPPPTDSSTPEPTMLFHDNLTEHNTLVNELGDLVPIIDWEFVSTVPLWRACQFPGLLDGRIRAGKPVKDEYVPDECWEEPWNTDPLDNEGVTDVYWEHTMEYEVGQLRVFLDEMKKLQPDWVKVMEDEGNRFKADFERAVTFVDNEFMHLRIKRWVASVKEGHPYSLYDAMWE
ncbi:hypothetical protein CC80DRAFT_511984 [Byssothecium circinans]|uniref:Uncharacterized protein n=1 Tax=Byssothecium circinans TaxID=147558 RepID=A0A6A5UEY7_9PLEO|nr:hypothetical protein CC80DRAFT_511984 [Byssothecium circinans]